jgi:hypothetical protein
MSYNTIPTNQPTNNKYLVYDTKNLKISFNNRISKEQIDFNTNKIYGYAPFNYDFLKGKYLEPNFRKRDKFTYIRDETTDKWIYENPYTKKDGYGALYYSQLRPALFKGYAPPQLFWIAYEGNNQFYLYRYVGNGLENIIEHDVPNRRSITFLYYTQENGTPYMKWINDVHIATRFTYSQFNINEIGWIKLDERPTL